MPRESIAMSTKEIATFIGSKKWVVLGTLNNDGSPSGDVVASALHGNRLVFGVPSGTRASVNIERDPRVVCMTDQYPTYYEIKGVAVHGRAERVTDTSLSERLPKDPIRPARTKGYAYAILLDDVTSFDFTKIKSKL